MRIAREAAPFALGLGAITAVLGVLWPVSAAIPGLALLFVLWFFRDPDRTPPAQADAIVCPADGRVLRAGPERISIFMNVLDVHVCRVPVGGTLRSIVHDRGRFLAAFRDEASEQNERATLLVDGPAGSMRFSLVAGLVARRIVTWVRAGQTLDAGDRVGVICFGSRVDVDLPPGAVSAVHVGDRVRAGETVIARLPVGAPGA